jgi:hypothetical protein
MAGVDATRAVAVGLLAVLVALDAAPIGLVFGVIFVLSCGETLFDPAAAGVAAHPDEVDMHEGEDEVVDEVVAAQSTPRLV